MEQRVWIRIRATGSSQGQESAQGSPSKAAVTAGSQAEVRLELQRCCNRGRHSCGVEQMGSNVKAIPKGKEGQVLASGILLSSPYQWEMTLAS